MSRLIPRSRPSSRKTSLFGLYRRLRRPLSALIRAPIALIHIPLVLDEPTTRPVNLFTIFHGRAPRPFLHVYGIYQFP